MLPAGAAGPAGTAEPATNATRYRDARAGDITRDERGVVLLSRPLREVRRDGATKRSEPLRRATGVSGQGDYLLCCW